MICNRTLWTGASIYYAYIVIFTGGDICTDFDLFFLNDKHDLFVGQRSYSMNPSTLAKIPIRMVTMTFNLKNVQ